MKFFSPRFFFLTCFKITKLNMVSLDFSDDSSQRINISIFNAEDENALKNMCNFTFLGCVAIGFYIVFFS